MSPQVVYQTQVGPEQPLLVPVTSTTVDLTTISSPTLQVLRPDGTSVTWTCTIAAGATTTTATFQRVFVSGDLAGPTGQWTVAPFAMVSSNPIEFPPQTIVVEDQWGRR